MFEQYMLEHIIFGGKWNYRQSILSEMLPAILPDRQPAIRTVPARKSIRAIG